MTSTSERPIPLHAWSRRRLLLTGGSDLGHPRPPRIGNRFRPPPTLRWCLRQVAGWLVLLYGIAGIVLPMTPAIVLIPAGAALIGRDQFLVRWLRSSMKLALRRAASWRGPLGRFGNRVRHAEKRIAKKLRDRRLGPWPGPRSGAESNPSRPG